MRNLSVCVAASKMFFISVLAFMIPVSIHASTLESARKYYNDRDYRAAITEYKSLLSYNWPKSQIADLYDGLSECLLIIGNYDQAEAKINEFLAFAPTGPLAEKLTVRKIQIAVNRGDYEQAASLADQYLSAHTGETPAAALARKLLAEAKAGKPDVSAATLETAKKSYDERNYGLAAAQYAALLKEDKSLAGKGEFIDQMTESLASVGKYTEAKTEIEAFLASHPTDPVAKKLMARKVQVAFDSKDYPTAIQTAKDFLAVYKEQSDACLPIEMKLLDAFAKANKQQELVDYVDQALQANPKHPLYAEMRNKQGDALTDSLKRDDDAVTKYEDGMAHAKPDSEAYENCSYRAGEVLFKQVRALGKSDPKKTDELTARGTKFYSDFLNHPGSEKYYPANARRRLVALKGLKQYDEMEKEAARYLSDDNRIRYNEKTSVNFIVGGFLIQPVDSGNAQTNAAFKDVRTAFYSSNFPKTVQLSKEFLARETDKNPQYFHVQRILVAALAKSGGAQEMIDYVDKALADNPNHPMYADLRRAQGDALYDTLKQEAAAVRKYEDALAHADKNSDVYDWCCYRAGDAMFKQASTVAKVDGKLSEDLKLRGREKFQEFVDLPSKDRIYPANIQRRMMAYNRLGKYDQLDREAARFLMDEDVNNPGLVVGVLRILSVSQAMRTTPNTKGAFASFEELKMRQSQITDANTKFNCGISMLRAADHLARNGAPAGESKKLQEAGLNFLREVASDESMRGTNQLDAYFYLHDWASIKSVATKKLERADPKDAATRTEMMNWLGIALAHQTPKDIEGAVASFERALQEYDKDPRVVADRSVVAVYWCVFLKMSQNQPDQARTYLRRLSSLPDCDIKKEILSHYGYLLENPK